jgi:lipopolysaccharide/colanic/teichoic acid biosynthesis glycosyltransferase
MWNPFVAGAVMAAVVFAGWLIMPRLVVPNPLAGARPVVRTSTMLGDRRYRSFTTLTALAILVAGLGAATIGMKVVVLVLPIGIIIAAAARPELAAYLYLGAMPFLAGIARDRLLPVLRPNEGLLGLLVVGLLVRYAIRLARGHRPRLRISRLEATLVTMAVASSVLPLLWLLARGEPLTQEQLLATLPLWKYYVLFLVIRAAVRSPRQARIALAVALVAASVVAAIAILQSLRLLGVPNLLAILWAPDVDSVSAGRGSSTLASSIAVGPFLALGVALASAWFLARLPLHRLALVAGILLGMGALASGQVSGVLALAVSVAVVAVVSGHGHRVVRLALPAALLGLIALWPVVAQRMATVSASGVPLSWLGRLDNLTTFYLPRLGDFNFILGVQPNHILQAPESWRAKIFLESGYLWLLWVGGIPFLLAFIGFCRTAMRVTARVARQRVDAVGVAAVGALAWLWILIVLMTIDIHLTMRGEADLAFALLALAVTTLGSERRTIVDVTVLPPPRPAPAEGPPASSSVTSGSPQTGVAGFAKRCLDATMATVLLLINAPIMLACAALIAATSRGPALFRQTRVGIDGRLFEIHKFRTMYVDNDDAMHRELCRRQLLGEIDEAGTADGSFKLENDPRITPVGRWLRAFSLDELPQFFNVLRGEMSLVGPRPALPWEADLYQPRHRRRLAVLPGITGLWQVSGRNRLSMLEMLDLDVEYVERWSLRRDLVILAKTPLVLIRGDGAR